MHSAEENRDVFADAYAIADGAWYTQNNFKTVQHLTNSTMEYTEFKFFFPGVDIVNITSELYDADTYS